MEVRLLGDIAIVDRGEAVSVRGAKQRRLLSVLALQAGEVVASDRLAAALWREHPPGNPANALQAQVSALRRVLPDGLLVTRGGGYTLAIDPDTVDVRRFERLVAEGRRLLAEHDAPAAASRLRDALDLWHGPALAEVADEELAWPERSRLDELRLTALETRIDADLAAGDHGAVVAELEALCADHPLRERFWLQRMLALYRCGRQADALRAYAEARHRLVDELGIEPGPELRQLEARILAQDATLDTTAPALPRSSRGAGNLRTRLTSFVGRDADLDDVAALLGEVRLVTLVGPGGAGKTRLAVEIAERLAGDVASGPWLVELAAVRDPAGVVPAISAALGVGPSTPGRPGEAPPGPIEQIARLLDGRPSLLVLDNCEHLVDEAAAVSDELLARAAALRILATSREALGVPGEVLRPVAPLGPDAAVELFVDRARAVSPGFGLDGSAWPVVRDICRRLDGLPLAIELAAAHVRVLSVRQVADRLDDRFRLLTGGARTALPRQQTLRAVVDWSYDLLFEDERRLFWRLSVFASGCRLDAAEAVCCDELLPTTDLVDLLGRLVDKSLVSVDHDDDGEPRYRQLQTLWQYAREKLADGGEADRIRTRHAAWFLGQARAASRGLTGSTGPLWRQRVSAELDDLRAALDWFIDHGDATAACQLATGMAWLWFLGAEWQEAARWLGDALGAPGDVPPAKRAMAESWLAYFVAFVDRGSQPVDAGRRAYEVLSTHGSDRQRAAAGLLLASTLNRAGGFAEALEVLEVTNRLSAATDSPWRVAMGQLLMAVARLRLGRLDEAETAARASVEQFEQLGDPWALLEPTGVIATVRDLRGDLRGALAGYDRLVGMTRPLSLPGYLTYWLVWRGIVRLRLGHPREAKDDFAEASELSRNPLNTVVALAGMARASAHHGQAEAAALLARQAGRLADEAGHHDALAAAIVTEGLTALELDDLGTAVELLPSAERADPAIAGLLRAAIAAASGERTRARELLHAWDCPQLLAAYGVVAGVLAADHARLLAALS